MKQFQQLVVVGTPKDRAGSAFEREAVEAAESVYL